MKNSLRIFCFGIVLQIFSMSALFSQELTGIWRGHFRSNDGLEQLMGSNDNRLKIDDRYKMEVQIAQTKNRFQAVTYSYKNTEFYGKAEATGTVNFKTKKVVLKEGKLLEVRLASGDVYIMTCFFQYSKLGNEEYLQGTYYSVNSEDTTDGGGRGSIFLHRVIETDFHKEPFLEKKELELLALKKKPGTITKVVPPVVVKKTTPKSNTVKKSNTLPPVAVVKPVKKQILSKPVSPPVAARTKPSVVVPEQGTNTRDSSLKVTAHTMPLIIPEVLKARTNVLLKTLTVSHNKIELRIYDDGAIDNDTVSVYYDNKLILSKVRLTDQAITMHIVVEPSDHPHELIMVAENLGEIPPNTSLLVVRDGEKRYEERIISTEQKNVQLNFVYKKTE